MGRITHFCFRSDVFPTLRVIWSRRQQVMARTSFGSSLLQERFAGRLLKEERQLQASRSPHFLPEAPLQIKTESSINVFSFITIYENIDLNLDHCCSRRRYGAKIVTANDETSLKAPIESKKLFINCKENAPALENNQHFPAAEITQHLCHSRITSRSHLKVKSKFFCLINRMNTLSSDEVHKLIFEKVVHVSSRL